MVQLLINRGDMVFTDETDALGSEYIKDSSLDNSMRLADVDGSGIDTILMSPRLRRGDDLNPVNLGRQSQYILVNDGTGRLYSAMHEEFNELPGQIADFVDRHLPEGRRAVADPIWFVAYSTASGTINFLAVVPTITPGPEGTPGSSPWSTRQYALVDVPLGINLTTDFRRDLIVSTCNGSKRIRTFAGDDTIHRALTDPDCAIDGGLGTDTVVYPGERADWVLTRTGETVVVSPAAGGGTDTLTNIERASFDDQTVDLTAL